MLDSSKGGISGSYNNNYYITNNYPENYMPNMNNSRSISNTYGESSVTGDYSFDSQFDSMSRNESFNNIPNMKIGRDYSVQPEELDLFTQKDAQAKTLKIGPSFTDDATGTAAQF